MPNEIEMTTTPRTKVAKEMERRPESCKTANSNATASKDRNALKLPDSTIAPNINADTKTARNPDQQMKGKNNMTTIQDAIWDGSLNVPIAL